MMDIIHNDEKWFYIKRVASSYAFASDEPPPYMACHNKSFILKVMFLSAVARPRHDAIRKRWWDGKIGIWPLLREHIAKRTTKNQKQGDIIMKLRSVDAAAFRSMLLSNLLPAVEAQWPG